MARSFASILLATALVTAASWGDSGARCLGAPGDAASYRIADAPAPRAASSIEAFTMTLGAEESRRSEKGQWLHLRMSKRDGAPLELWLLCSAYPLQELGAAHPEVLRYILRAGDTARP